MLYFVLFGCCNCAIKCLVYIFFFLFIRCTDNMLATQRSEGYELNWELNMFFFFKFLFFSSNFCMLSIDMSLNSLMITFCVEWTPRWPQKHNNAQYIQSFITFFPLTWDFDFGLTLVVLFKFFFCGLVWFGLVFFPLWIVIPNVNVKRMKIFFFFDKLPLIEFQCKSINYSYWQTIVCSKSSVVFHLSNNCICIQKE